MKRALLLAVLFFCFALPRIQAADGAISSIQIHPFEAYSSHANKPIDRPLAPWAPGGCVSTKLDSVPEKKVKTEKVEGFWSVMGYFGSKLTSELGQRLNLVEAEEESEPVEVQLKIGSFELTRNEKRKKSI